MEEREILGEVTYVECAYRKADARIYALGLFDDGGP